MASYIFEYRELIKNLVISDLKVKYASSVLGFAWSMLNPLMMLLVLYFVFSNVFKDQHNFAVYMLIGLLAWRFFTNGTMSRAELDRREAQPCHQDIYTPGRS